MRLACHASELECACSAGLHSSTPASAPPLPPRDPDPSFPRSRLCSPQIGNNALGIAGLNWKVKLLVCRFIWNDGSGYVSDAMNCIKLCRQEGAMITSNSWGGIGYSSARWACCARCACSACRACWTAFACGGACAAERRRHAAMCSACLVSASASRLLQKHARHKARWLLNKHALGCCTHLHCRLHCCTCTGCIPPCRLPRRTGVRATHHPLLCRRKGAPAHTSRPRRPRCRASANGSPRAI